MHALIEQDIQDHPVDTAQIIYVGDYIDRGPDSKGVLDILCAREKDAPHIKHVFLMGNHENGMLEFIKEPNGARQDWIAWGGIEALESYGVMVDGRKDLRLQAEGLAKKLVKALPDAHMEFLSTLELKYELGGYVFVHAGIDPLEPLNKQVKQNLIMIREPFLSYPDDLGFRVVHGHTITNTKKPDVRDNRMNIDTGLYAGGPLTCTVLEGSDVRFIEAWQEI